MHDPNICVPKGCKVRAWVTPMVFAQFFCKITLFLRWLDNKEA